MKKEMKQRAEPILLGFALRTYQSGGKARIHIRFGRIGLVLLALLAVGWLTTATTLYFYFKKGFQLDRAGIGIREHDTDLSWDGVKFTGMLALPFRMDEHRKELGDYYIHRAEVAVNDKEYMQALDLLRLGVAKSPGNLRGRRILSEFFDYGFKQHDDAANILVKGIKHGGNEDIGYLLHVFKFLLFHEYDERVIEIGEKLLGEWKGQEKDEATIAMALANAYFHQYHFGKAHELISEYSLRDNPDGNLLIAEMHWRRGEREEAFAILQKTARRFPHLSRVYTKISNFQEQAGDHKKALRTIVLAQINNPDNLNLAIQVLKKLHAAGETDRLEEMFSDMLESFANDLNSSIGLTNTMAGMGLPANCQKVAVKAANMGISDPRFQLAVLTGRILAGQTQEALLLAGDLAREADEWKIKHYSSQLTFLLAFATYAKGDAARGKALMKDFLDASEEAPPPGDIHRFSGYLNSLGFGEQARQILEFGKKRYSSYRPILEEIARQDIAVGHHPGLPESVRDLLQASRKDAALLLECRERLASDFYMFVPEQGDLLDSLANSLRKIKSQGALPEGANI